MPSIGFKNPGAATISTTTADLKRPAFSEADWKKDFDQAINDAAKSGVLDGARLADAGVIDRLDKAPPEIRFRLVLDTLLDNRASAPRARDVLAQLIAQRYDRPVDDVRKDVYAQLELLCAEPVRGAHHVSQIAVTSLIAGKTTVDLAGEDITKITGADVIGIPGHRAKLELGGGNRGGIEAAFLNRAQQLGDEGMASAIKMFEELRGDNVLNPGATIAVPSGTTRGVTAGAFIMGASVAPANVQANPELSRAHLAHVLKSYLDDAATRGLDLAGRSPSDKNPPTIVVPPMGIGVEAGFGVTPQLAGAVFHEVLEQWAKDHAGVRVIITTPNAETRASFQAGWNGEAGATSAAKTPDRMLNELVKGFEVPVHNNAGGTLNASTVEAGLRSAVDGLRGAMPSKVPSDAYDFVSKGFNGRPQMEAAWQMHRFLTVPAFAEALGVPKGGAPTADSMNALLDVISGKKPAPNKELAGLKEAVMREVLRHPALAGLVDKPNQFGGVEKLPEIMGMAVAKVLRERRTDALDNIVASHQAELAAVAKDANAALDEMKKKLGGADAAELGMLRAKLVAAEAGAAEVDSLKAELRKLATKNSKLEGEVRTLEQALDKQKGLTSTYQSRVSNYSSSS